MKMSVKMKVKIKMKRAKKHHYLALAILFLIIVALGAAYYFIPNKEMFSSPEYVRNLLVSFGGWGYLVFMLLIILSVPLPIPSLPVIIAGGYVYGTLVGSAIAIVAAVMGALVSFSLARKLGEPLLEMLMDKKHLHHFLHLFSKRGISLALVSYIVPVFPADTIGLLMGLTTIRMRTFFVLAMVGNIPRCIVLNLIGSDLYTGFTLRSYVLLGVVVILAIMAVFREKLKRLMFKELRELETETKIVEKGIEKEMKKEVNKKKIKYSY